MIRLQLPRAFQCALHLVWKACYLTAIWHCSYKAYRSCSYVVLIVVSSLTGSYTALSWVSASRVFSCGHVIHEVGWSLCSMCRYVLITSFDDT